MESGEAVTDEQLAEIAARCAASTPGPWERSPGSPAAVLTQFPTNQMTGHRVFYNKDGAKVGEYLGVCFGITSCPYWEQQWNDLDFIAHAREDVPALLVEIARLKAVTP